MAKEYSQFFEDAFKAREEFSSDYGPITIIDITPEKQMIKEPVFLASGWAETLEALKGTVSAFVEQGFRVIIADYSELKYGKIALTELPKSAYVKSQALINVFKQKGIDKLYTVAHSEGAMNATIACYLSPGFFKTLILVTPGGCYEK